VWYNLRKVITVKKCLLLLIIFLLVLPITARANIICNDGTESSRCQDCHRGCCSGHGGCTDNPNHYSNSNSDSYNINEPTTHVYNSNSYNTTQDDDEIEDEDIKYGILTVSAVSFVTSMICFIFIKPTGLGGKI
jgi:hypothetical protein